MPSDLTRPRDKPADRWFRGRYIAEAGTALNLSGGEKGFGMRRATRWGLVGARRGVVATLIVAAASAGAVAAAPAGDLAAAPPSEAPQDGRPRYIVETRDQAGLERTLTELGRLGVEPVDVWDRAMFGFVVALDTAEAEYVRGLPDVTNVDPETVMTAAETQVDPPWGLDRIDQAALPLDHGYSYVGTGAGVKLYVIDSGLRTSHAELTGRVGNGWFWDFGDDTGISDCNGHGTHVAGTAGGTTYGVAKGVTIIPVKVLACDGTGSDASVIGGIEFVIEDHPDGAAGGRQLQPRRRSLGLPGLGGAGDDRRRHHGGRRRRELESELVQLQSGPRPDRDHGRRIGDRRRRRQLLELRVVQRLVRTGNKHPLGRHRLGRRVDDEERYLDGIAARCGCGGIDPAVQSAGDASAGLGRDRRGDDQGRADRVLWRSGQALAHRRPVGHTAARDADADGGAVGHGLRHGRVSTGRHLVWNELRRGLHVRLVGRS